MSIDLDVLDGGIAVVTINRPEKRNALDAEHYQALSEAWKRVRDDDAIRVAIVTGAGDKAFSAGADLKSWIGREVKLAEMWQTQQRHAAQPRARDLEAGDRGHQRPLPRRRHDADAGDRHPRRRGARHVRAQRGQARHHRRQRRHAAAAAAAAARHRDGAAAHRRLHRRADGRALGPGQPASCRPNRSCPRRSTTRAASPPTRRWRCRRPRSWRCARSDTGLAAGLRIEQFVNRILQRTQDAAEGRRRSPRSARQVRTGSRHVSVVLSGRYVIAGIGHTAFGKLPGSDTVSLNVEACPEGAGRRRHRQGRGRRGVREGADLVATSSCTARRWPRRSASRRASAARGTRAAPPTSCCSSFAIMAIEAGQCDVALGLLRRQPAQRQPRRLRPRARRRCRLRLVLPPPAGYAMIHRRHMIEFGTRPEHFAAVAMASRRHGAREPERAAAQAADAGAVHGLAAGWWIRSAATTRAACPTAAAALVVMSAERARELGVAAAGAGARLRPRADFVRGAAAPDADVHRGGARGRDRVPDGRRDAAGRGRGAALRLLHRSPC